MKKRIKLFWMVLFLLFLLVLFITSFFVFKRYTGFVTFEDASQSNFSKYTTSSILNLLQEYGVSDKQFKEIKIRDSKVFFHQRMIDNAIVEKDFILYQFNESTKKLMGKKIKWRTDLPEHFPPGVITKEQAESMVRGEVQFSGMYIISPESDVFPIKPTPQNPCWVVTSIDNDKISVTVIDTIDGKKLGYGIPPPYTAFSLTGPTSSGPCSGGWTGWYQNAETWFNTMGYSTEAVAWPTEANVQSHIQSSETAMFYELAHGGSTSFASGCSGGTSYETTYASEIETWIANYRKMPFTFIGSCDGMCTTTDNTLSYEFRKGSTTDTATVGYCGMSGSNCATYCWYAGYTISWQTALFTYMNNGDTVKEAFDQANADYPGCADYDCMLFAGDENLIVVPVVARDKVPNVTLNEPIDNYNLSNSSIIFNCSATDDGGLANITLYGNWTSSWHANETVEISGTDNSTEFNVTLEEGVYEWNCLAYDSISQSDWSDTNRTFTIDTTPPMVSLEAPLNNSVNKTANSIDFTFNVTDFLDIVNCSLIINDDENFTVNNTPKDTADQNITVWLNIGDYNWTINCTDLVNNHNSTFVYNLSIIDVTKPEVSLDYPADGFNTSSNTIGFNFTAIELYLDMCELWGNWSDWHLNQSYDSFTASITQNFSDISLSEGMYIWNVWCNDTSNNANFSVSNYTFTVDMTPPVISMEYPDNNTVNTTANSIDFTFNVTDFSDIANCSVIINDEINATSSGIIKDITQNITVWLNLGEYNWTINCTDLVNNINESGLVYNLSLVDDILPEVNLDYPSDVFETSSSTVGFNFTVTELYLDTCELWGNWSEWHLNQTYESFTAGITQNFSNVSLPEGDYIWNVWCNDTSNNANFSVSNYTFRVDNTAPSVNLQNPVNGETSTKGSINFTYQVSDVSSISTCSLYINGSQNTTSSSITKETNQTFTDVTLFNDEYEWYVRCTDGAGNSANSETRYLTQTCTESWGCTDWSTCTNSQQTRTCTENNGCFTNGSKPSESQSCSSGGSAGGGGGGGGAGTASAFDVDFSIQRVKTLRTAENSISTLSFDGVTQHTIKIDEVTLNSAMITISSEPVTITIKVGEKATVDLNKDGVMDLEITLDSIMGSSADIVVSKLTGADIIAQEDTAASKQKFSLSKTEIRTEATQGETVQETFRIRNDGIEPLLLNLKVSNDLKGYVILSKDSIVLNKGGEENIDVNFLAPATLEPKLYSGKIIVGTDLKQLSLPLQMTVKKRTALFDVKVKIPDKFKTVYPGESVFADITLLNIGKIGQVDVDVYYAIKNLEGTVLTFSKETVGVEVATSFTKTLTLPEDVTAGNYTYFVKITYKDTSTTGEDYFLVKSRISYIPTIIQKRLVEILVWVFGTALLFMLYFLARSKFKERYLEKEETELKRKEKEIEERVSKIEKKGRLPSFEELFYKQSLTKFCKEKLEQGYTEKQVTEAAVKAGWQEETIRGVLKGLQK